MKGEVKKKKLFLSLLGLNSVQIIHVLKWCILGWPTLNSISNVFPVVTNQMSPDRAKCPLEDRGPLLRTTTIEEDQIVGTLSHPTKKYWFQLDVKGPSVSTTGLSCPVCMSRGRLRISRVWLGGHWRTADNQRLAPSWEEEGKRKKVEVILSAYLFPVVPKSFPTTCLFLSSACWSADGWNLLFEGRYCTML